MIALALSLLAAVPPRVAVMPLSGGVAISDRAAGSLTDALALELQTQGGTEVVLPRVTGTLLSPTKPRQVVGCTADACMADVAAGLDAERVVAGEVSWDGARLVLTLRLLEARSARTLAMSERAFPKGTLNELLGALPQMCTELLRALPAAATRAGPIAKAAPGKPAPAPRAAADAPSPEKQAPAGRFVLHYHRRDGRYRSVGLWAWESFELDAEVRRMTAFIDRNFRPPSTPSPDGIDDFGAHWTLPAHEFRNGRVNFLVRDGDAWDACGPRQGTGSGKALFWVLADGAEVWLNVPECELYATREEAVRNQRK